MHGANTGSTARQDLAALGHIAAELCGVLIVDGRGLIDAELANFSALTILGVVLIESQSCILLSKILERQLAVAVVKLGKCGGSGIHASRRVVSGAGAAVTVGVAVAAGIAAVAALALAEIYVVNNDLRAAALAAVTVGPVADLQTAGNDCHAALGEILADKFGGLTPCNAVDEIGLLFSAVAAAEIAVNSEAEGCHRRLGLGVPEFGIPCQAAHNNNVIKHRCAPYSARRVIRRRRMPSVIPRIRSSSAGNSAPLVNFIST